MAKYDPTYYKNNKEAYARRAKAFREERNRWFLSLKEGKPCEDCGGIFHPKAMHWHHLNGKDKEFTMSEIRRSSKEKILKELDKCILICANCHAVRTWL
jgi:uncharacterized OB-fold protein